MKREILYLAMPVIAENLLQTLLGTADMYFAGQLSDNAIAGIGVTSLIMNMFISGFTAVSAGSTAVTARYYGEGAAQKVNSAVVHSLYAGLGLGILPGLFCAVFRRELLHVTGADAAVIEAAMPYYLIVTVPCVFLCLQLILSACLRAMKDTKTPMYVTGVANILNLALNFAFMKLGMGIFGLGLATTVSRGLAMVVMGKILLGERDMHLFSCKGLRREEFYTLLKIGVPAGMEKLIMRIGQLVYNGMILSIGTYAYVAHNVAGTIESYSYIPAMGFGIAISTMTGVFLGEKNIDGARTAVKETYLLSAGVMIGIGTVFYLFAPQFASLFSETAAVQEQVVQVLRIIAWFQPFAALVQIMTGALQGAGDTRFPMYATFIGIWGLRIGLGYFLAVPFGMGLSGVWFAYAADLVVRGLLLLERFRRGKWQKIEI